MPDFRQSRDQEYLTQPLLSYQNDPSYTPQDQVGGMGMGGAGNEGGIQQAHAELLDRLTGGLNRSEQLGQESRGLMDALQANHEAQRAGGSGLDLGGAWQGIKDAGSKGMDLLGQGINAITPSQEGYDNFAMRLQRAGAIANNQIPLYMREQQQQMEMTNHQDQMSSRRQQLAQHLEGINEQKRHHNMQVMEKLLATGNLEALKEFGKEYPPAAILAKATNEADMMEIPSYIEKGWLSKQDIDDFHGGKWTPNKAKVKLGQLRKRSELVDKHEAEIADLKEALNGDYNQLDAYHKGLVDDYKAKTDLTKAKTGETESQNDERKAHAEWLRKQVEMGPKGQQSFGHDREALSQQMFQGPYGQQSAGNMEKINKALLGFQGQQQLNKSTAVQQAQLAVPDKLSDTAREKTATDLSTLDLVDSMAKNYNREWVGPARGRGGAVMEKYSGMPGVPHIGEDEARFRSDITTLKNGVIKAITGAQMSEPEAERIMGQIPDANNPPEVFEARMKSTRANLKRMAERRREVLDKTGASTTDLPGVPKGEKKAKQEEYIETRTTKDGRKLGKTKDGRIVEIK